VIAPFYPQVCNIIRRCFHASCTLFWGVFHKHSSVLTITPCYPLSVYP
jgi:hypothetical protein